MTADFPASDPHDDMETRPYAPRRRANSGGWGGAR